MKLEGVARGAGSPGARLRVPLLAGVVLALGAIAHFGAVDAQFVFDGPHMATGLEQERWAFRTLLLDRKGATSSGRPVMAASWAANLVLADWPAGAELPDPRGFLLVNVAIHLAAGLALFALLRRLLPRLAAEPPGPADGLAFAAAALWIVHPLTTAAVVHAAQRAEALMALFFILSLLAAWRATDSPHRVAWGALASGLAWLCVGSKEVGATLPLAFALLDRARTGHGFARVLRERAPLYLGLASSWLLLAAQIGVQARGPTVGWFSEGLNPLNYLLTQARALVTYASLVAWPSPLILDRGWPLVDVHRVSDLASELPSYGPALVCVGAALIATLWGLARHSRAALPSAMAFLVLAPTSSFLPIRTEIVAEHRMYLPLAALLTGLVVVGWTLVRRRSTAIRALALLGWLAAVLACTLVTQARNREHHDAAQLWQRNAVLTPDNPRALARAGTLLLKREPFRARTRLREALRVAEASSGPSRQMLADIHLMLGIVEEGFGRVAPALSHLEQSLAEDPTKVDATIHRVRILAREGDLERAVAIAEHAYRDEEPYRALGPTVASLQLRLGRVSEARHAMARYLGSAPDAQRVTDELVELARAAERPELVLRILGEKGGRAPPPEDGVERAD